MDTSDFIEVVDNTTTNDVSTPEPSVIALIAKLRNRAAKLQKAFDILQTAKPNINGLALELLVCGVACVDYPTDHDNVSFRKALGKVSNNCRQTNEPGKRALYAVDDDFLKSHLSNVKLVVDLAVGALKAGELSLTALYKTDQPLRAAWGNLTPILLARAATLEANIFFRGRLFE